MSAPSERPLRKPLLFLLGLVALLLAGGYLLLWLTAPPRHRITEESYAQIREGMTESEAEQTLGGPAGDYTRGRAVPTIQAALDEEGRPLWEGDFLLNPGSWAQEARRKTWVGETWAVYVAFDEQGRVKEALKVGTAVPPDTTLLARLRRWLGIRP